MTHHLMATPTFASGMALAGIAFGLVYFTALRRSVDLYCAGGSGLGLAALTIGRLGAAALLLGLPAALGAVPLLAAFLGFLIARVVALRTARRAG